MKPSWYKVRSKLLYLFLLVVSRNQPTYCLTVLLLLIPYSQSQWQWTTAVHEKKIRGGITYDLLLQLYNCYCRQLRRIRVLTEELAATVLSVSLCVCFQRERVRVCVCAFIVCVHAFTVRVCARACQCLRAGVKLYLHTWNIILDIVILVVEASKLSVEQMFRLLLFILPFSITIRVLEVYTQEVPKPN